MPLFRADQALIHVAVDGIPIDNLPWDVLQGADNTSDSINYHPGGMAPSVELGGLPKRGDATVERVWSDTLAQVYKTLDSNCGKAGVTLSYTTLDPNGLPTGPTFTYTGILKSVTRPDYDSNTSAEAKLKIVVGLNGSLS